MGPSAKWYRDVAFFDGKDVHCVILDMKISEDANGNGCFSLICQTRTPNFTS